MPPMEETPDSDAADDEQSLAFDSQAGPTTADEEQQVFAQAGNSRTIPAAETAPLNRRADEEDAEAGNIVGSNMQKKGGEEGAAQE